MLRKAVFIFLSIAVVFSLYYVYHVHINYRFTEISENKVYRSAAMPSEKLTDYVKKFGIKTVIDLREGEVSSALNPSLTSYLSKEKKVLEELGGVKYLNIPSRQIPSNENLEVFFAELDNESSYPVLIHCHHGTGRAVLYSALYRIKYENYTNEQARRNTSYPLKFSSFDHGTPKGEWLKKFSLDYKDGNSTLVLEPNEKD